MCGKLINNKNIITKIMKKIIILILGIVIILVGIYFLNTTKNKKQTKNINENQKLSIVASFYPLAFMAEKIGGDLVTVKNLAGSVSPHKYQLTPQDIVSLKKADLILVQGLKLEPWSDDIDKILSNKKNSILKVTENLPIHSLDVNHDNDSKDNEDEHNHEHGKFDPHTWLSPELSQKMVDNITDKMKKLDPKNASVFQKNANLLKKHLKSLDMEFKNGLSSCKKSDVIVSHNAYGYISSRYGFKTYAIAGISITDEPSAKNLVKLKKISKDKKIKYILVEKNSVKKFANTLANETGLKPLPLNPLARGTLDKNKNFFDVMEENLKSFQTALECK